MGHGQYSQDVAHEARAVHPSWAARTAVHPQLDPKAGPREVNNATPIVLAMDVTRSRGDDTRRLYDQLPLLMKRLEERGYVEGPGISFAAVGDATADRAPLQVSQFEADNRLDAALSAMWIEEGGGGTGQESYELAAWYYAGTDCVRLREGTGGKGFFFFVGDEAFYPKVHGEHRAGVLGQEAVDVDAREAFRRLGEKFHVFLIYPGKPMSERRADIDAEIRRRVLGAGGQHDNVDVRVSLVWDNRNDLDLYVTSPSGETVYFSHKQSACGGALDVDRNIGGETLTPVENIRWVKGTAPDGQYRVKVQNFRFHEPDQAPTPFRVEVEVGGDLQMYEGVISPGGQVKADSDVQVCAFTFTADAEARRAAYNAYSDEVVLRSWAEVLPPGHLLRLRDAEQITAVILGALGIASGKETHASYAERLRAEGLGDEAIRDVATALVACHRVSA
ncbi:MAG TPA: proprotein convertase P-domain-containing protein [Myxococcota bacterium]|nr:proprotein convertase P-domain-containing protein [Myxococcota bacterium]